MERRLSDALIAVGATSRVGKQHKEIDSEMRQYDQGSQGECIGIPVFGPRPKGPNQTGLNGVNVYIHLDEVRMILLRQQTGLFFLRRVSWIQSSTVVSVCACLSPWASESSLCLLP